MLLKVISWRPPCLGSRPQRGTWKSCPLSLQQSWCPCGIKTGKFYNSAMSLFYQYWIYESKFSAGWNQINLVCDLIRPHRMCALFLVGQQLFSNVLWNIILSVLYDGAFIVIKNYIWYCFIWIFIESKSFLFNNIKN